MAALTRLGGLLIVCTAFSACSATTSTDLSIDLSGACSNPTLDFEGERWTTADRVPTQWLLDGRADGVFVVDSSAHARFVGAGGTTLEYARAEGFIALECAIGGDHSDLGTPSSLVPTD